MSTADVNGSAAGVRADQHEPGLEPEALWDLYDANLWAMARTLLGEESASLHAVTLGMVDLYRPSGPDARVAADDALHAAAASVYQRFVQMPANPPGRRPRAEPVAAARLAHLADLQRRTLALCVFGGHTYRQAAIALDVPAGTTAQLLVSGLRDLVR